MGIYNKVSDISVPCMLDQLRFPDKPDKSDVTPQYTVRSGLSDNICSPRMKVHACQIINPGVG